MGNSKLDARRRLAHLRRTAAYDPGVTLRSSPSTLSAAPAAHAGTLNESVHSFEGVLSTRTRTRPSQGYSVSTETRASAPPTLAVRLDEA